MVDHPSAYPWSSYRYNILGKTDELISPHEEYRHLGKTAKERQTPMILLFHVCIGIHDLDQQKV